MNVETPGARIAADPPRRDGEGEPAAPGTADYRVDLEVFEGPLDLLLYLIRREEVDIHEVCLERITGQYLEYLEVMKALNIEFAGEFLVMAATLLYIKSRSVLPPEEQTTAPGEDDPLYEHDPREELIRKLIEYRRFKDAALHLEVRLSEAEGLFPRPHAEDAPAAPDPGTILGEVSLFDLIAAFQSALRRAGERMARHEVFEEEYAVADKIEEILRRVAATPRLWFGEVFEGARNRHEFVTIFLALLELIRLRQVRVRQETPFGDIEVLGAAA